MILKVNSQKIVSEILMTSKLVVPRPSKKVVDSYLKLWDELENYSLQESSIEKLFGKTYPKNIDLDDVLIKVCSLNTFYSTNIFSPFTVAKHIINLKVDQSLRVGDLDIVNKIAKVTMKGGQVKNFYSFASKYCSHHNRKEYPIYDSFVEKMLLYFRKYDRFATFHNKDLKQYGKFRDILLSFRKFYDLEDYDLKKIDKYLWLAGKEYFPRKY